MNRSLPGRVHLVTRLNHVAHRDCLDLGVIELAAREHRAQSRCTQLRGRRLLQSTAERANGGAKRSRENYQLLWHGPTPLVI
jgi:hypothetical protein